MRYEIKQINFTDAQVDEINKSDGNVDYYKQYLKTMCMPTVEAIKDANDLYKTVAFIDAQDLEQVFEIGNIGPEYKIERISPMHSLSVGDIIVDEDGVHRYVDSFGFKVLA